MAFTRIMIRTVTRIVVFLLCLSVLPAHANKKVALVIGNASYTIGALDNPVNDANDMATMLTRIGFDEVILRTDAGAVEMNRALREFGQKLDASDLGLFYYAGHGMQVKGRNYLLPVDADIQSEDEIPFQSIDAGQVLAKMEAAGNLTNLIFLDACRDNPFARSWRSSTVGLVQMDSLPGSLIAYATAPGTTAADGAGRNGVFTGALLEALEQPGEDISIVLRNTAKQVRRETNGEQVPWVSSSLTEEVVLNVEADSEGANADTETTAEEKEKPADADAQTAFWNGISSSKDPEDFAVYLALWPDGVFASLAQNRIEALNKPDTDPVEPVSETNAERDSDQQQPVAEVAETANEAPEAGGKDSAIIVFDGSGSMWGQIDGKTKIEIARDVMGTLVDDWNQDVDIGLLAYGHREKGNCNDIEVLRPVATIDRGGILQEINRIQPKGKTPISLSLRTAADTLRFIENKATVILVSDGEETCNADPCAVSRELEQQGIDFTAHVIGFDIGKNQEAKNQLQCIADNTGGKFFEAEDAAGLKDSLNKVKETVAVKVETVKVKTSIGSLKVQNTKDFVTVRDPESNERKANIPRADTPVQLNAGRYDLEFDNFSIRGIDVIAGETTVVDARDYSGWIVIKNTKDFVSVRDPESGERKGNIPRADTPVQLGVGTYALKFENLELDNVEIVAGETTVIDASKLSGWITLKNTKDFVSVRDPESGDRKGNIPRADTPVQLTIGTYDLKFENFVINGIDVVAGETTVVDVGEYTGWVTLKNTKDFVTVHDAASDQKEGNIPRTDVPVQLAVGTYNLKFENFVIEDVALTAGDNKVIDAGQHSGWIRLENTGDFITVYDQDTGEKAGVIPRSDKDVQFAPGNYRLKAASFEVADVAVKAGQKTVLKIE